MGEAARTSGEAMNTNATATRIARNALIVRPPFV
jgi:hypothetical protein